MATAKQIEANRLNARKSTGPRTAAGRSASSLNAYKHGLTGQTLIMTEEQAEARERFITSMVDDLRPAGAMEAQLARSVADTHWRINRAVAIEENIFAHEAWAEENQVVKMAAQLGQESDYNDVSRARAQVRSFTSDPKRFHLLTTYEMRLHRKAQSDLKQLRELQAARRAEAEKAEKAQKTTPVQPAPEKAKAPSAVIQPPGSTAINPANGFVFSDEGIDEGALAAILAADHAAIAAASPHTAINPR